MMKQRSKSLLLLHFIAFLWGFTAVLGKGIRLEAELIVFYRMGIATFFLALYLYYKGYSLRLSFSVLKTILIAGFFLTIHWFTFFAAIKASNVSVTLATMSSGALFVALIEPILYKRKLYLVELLLGFFVILGISLIFTINPVYRTGIYFGLLSSFFAALFTVINGRLITQANAVVISFYELMLGFLLTGLFLLFRYSSVGLTLPVPDWSDSIKLLILGTICTAYAFTVSILVMKHLSPFTVALTTNLEPIYGILLAVLIFGQSEYMAPRFYLGAGIIIAALLAEEYLKSKKRKQ